MKTTISMLMIILLVIAVPVLSDEYIYDSKERCVGRIDERGFIFDDKYGGKKIGRVESNGDIYNDSYGGERIGTVRHDNHDKPRGGAEYLLKESHHNDE
jgi:hypothetical protein